MIKVKKPTKKQLAANANKMKASAEKLKERIDNARKRARKQGEMMLVEQILQWARERGYTAVYGSAEQVNEMLTDVPFADSKDGTAVIMHLITDSATVDGRDRAVVAVYFASLCDFDFDGEALFPEQERLKGIGKDLLNFIRTGNEMTYADPRWQYGYDDYAENVCWVCLRVTLTASAADCVPLEIPVQ